MNEINELERDKLLGLVRAFAKNWLAHDGLWFQAVERAHGLDNAIELDAEAWSRFSPIEAKRIKQLFGIQEGGGLEALAEALKYRLYAVLNTQKSEWVEGKLRFYMNECRVQTARKRKGLPDFPCKPVGMMEFTRFAETIDARIQTRCITCPPDPVNDDTYCAWKFTLREQNVPETEDRT